VANFGFAVNNRRKNPSSGQWEDDPVFIDMAVFNRGESGRQADLAEQSLRKGHQVFIDGHLKLDQWTSQDGQKRSKLSVVVDNFQFLEPRSEGTGGGSSRRPVQGNVPPTGGDFEHASDFDPAPSGGDEGIPF
jgi:single-strand DNA-binding protein